MEILTTKELEQVLEAKIPEILEKYEHSKMEKSRKVVSRNKAREMLTIGYGKLDKLIEQGTIKETIDGKYITEHSINVYVRLIENTINE